MKIRDFKDSRKPYALKLPMREVSHVVIEPNYSCNMHCQTCYNLEKKIVKTVAEIKDEIDLAMKRRNVETFSILGGEPTLHPDLCRIVEYVKAKKRICNILTNGLKFLEPGGDDLVNRLARSGVDRIVLHADCGQPRHGSGLDEFIGMVFDRLEARRISFSLSITVYPENRGMIPDFMKRYARYRYYDGLLATIVKDPMSFAPTGAPDIMARENGAIRDRLNVPPSAYIPSSLDGDFISWLIYVYSINIRSGRTFVVSPAFNRLFRRIYRLATGHNVFGMKVSPRWLSWSCLATLLAECALDPDRLADSIGLLRDSRSLRDLRFHYIMIQSGPEWNERAQAVQICYHCPDATVRNGKLTPVCLADIINPIGRPCARDHEALRDTVYRHLGESA